VVGFGRVGFRGRSAPLGGRADALRPGSSDGGFSHRIDCLAESVGDVGDPVGTLAIVTGLLVSAAVVVPFLGGSRQADTRLWPDLRRTPEARPVTGNGRRGVVPGNEVGGQVARRSLAADRWHSRSDGLGFASLVLRTRRETRMATPGP
jgi:hypothetical protein